jgi:hypothetical protein
MPSNAKKKVATVRPDAKGRVTLGRFAEGVSSFRVHEEAGGRIVLEPFVEVPARERWVYESPHALASVKRGLAQSAAGKVKSLGSFAKYADDEIE